MTGASWSAGDASTTSACCASSGWSSSPDQAAGYRRFMSDAVMKRQVTALIGRCHAGLGAVGLRDEVLRRLRPIMPVDAAFFGTVDPHTLLFTSAPAAAAAAGAPGTSLLDQDLPLVSRSPEAARWLAEIGEADWPGGSELPVAVYAAAVRLARLEGGATPPPLSASIRLRSRSGRW